MRALLFDLDDTLIADTRDARSALDEVCEAIEADATRRGALVTTVIQTARTSWASPRYGGELADELGISGVEALYSELVTCHERVQTITGTQQEYKHQVWTMALAAHGHEVSTDDIDGLIDAFRTVRGSHVTVYDEVPEVLAELAESHRLGIITNGPADLQRLKLEATGLEDLFGVVVISGELGWGKPSVAPFTHAMTVLGTVPGTTTMLGDNVLRDVAGAVAADVGAVLVTRPDLDLILEFNGETVEAIEDLRPLLDRR